MKKIGIVADNYKLEKFIKELTAKGFVNAEVTIYKDDMSTIMLMVPEDKVNEIKNICTLVELHFKRSN